MKSCSTRTRGSLRSWSWLSLWDVSVRWDLRRIVYQQEALIQSRMFGECNWHAAPCCVRWIQEEQLRLFNLKRFKSNGPVIRILPTLAMMEWEQPSSRMMGPGRPSVYARGPSTNGRCMVARQSDEPEYS